MEFVNQRTYNYLDWPGEDNKEPSQTIPNQTMSLQDMVNKFTISSEWPKNPLPEQFDNVNTLDIKNIMKMDRMEQEDYKKTIQDHIEETKLELKDIQDDQKAAKLHQEQIIKQQKINDLIKPKEDIDPQ